MRILMASAFLLSLAAAAAEVTAGNPSRPTTPAAPASSSVKVQMIAATLEEDCGGTGAPWQKPAPHPAPLADVAPIRSKMKMESRACQQTSMQLSVVAGTLARSAEIHVKKVEILDTDGTSLGELTPRSPMVWSARDSAYVAWKETVASGESLSVSYALSAPDWSRVPERWGKTFVVRATITAGGADQTAQREVHTETETRLPPGVKT